MCRRTITSTDIAAVGYDVTYLPLGTDGDAYLARLKTLGSDLELGEVFAIIAYGDAAAICLRAVLKPLPHLCALICYYPTSLPSGAAKYPTQLKLTVHLTVSQGFTLNFGKTVYKYAGVEPGFAEHDCDEYSRIEAQLAWTRTLAAVRRGFKKDESEKVEGVWDQQQAVRRVHKDATAVAGNMAPDAEAAYLSALTGAVGQKSLYRFYSDFFIGKQPPSMKVRLLSRTVGVDRVVDEMIVSFRHDREVQWMLPGVPATGKNVEIPVVSIVGVRGSKLVHEHVYWDQASVLLQIGLLDPTVVPGYMRKQGLQALPIAGSNQAAWLRNPETVALNGLVSGWKGPEGRSESLPVRTRPSQQLQRGYSSDSPPPTPSPKSNVRGGRPPKRQGNGQTPVARGRKQA